MLSATIPTATVKLRKHNGQADEVYQEAGTGDGPVDAVLKAIDRITNIKGTLIEYNIRAVSQGKDAMGEVTIKADFGDKKLIPGKGASTDVIEASARAYLNALNRFITTSGKIEIAEKGI